MRALLVGLLLTFNYHAYAVWAPEHFFPGIRTNPMDLSSADEHAIALIPDAIGNIVYASYFSDGIWTDQILDSDAGGFPGFPVAIDMDGSGTGLAVWGTNTGVRSAFFDGSTWSTPIPVPVDAIFVSGPGIDVDMNGPTSGLGVWVDNFIDVRSSFFSAGVWSVPVTIGTGANIFFAAQVAYSSNGTAVVVWQDNTDVVASTYAGGVWGAQMVIGSAGSIGGSLSVGIDASGRAVAFWREDATTNVVARTFNGTFWEATVVVSTDTSAFSTSFSMSASGVGVATWMSTGAVGLSSIYNGTSWSAPFQFTSELLYVGGFGFQNRSVSVNDNGQALVVFFTEDLEVRAARLNIASGAWFPDQFIAEGFQADFVAIASLGNDGSAFAGWQFISEGIFSAHASYELVLDPLVLSGSVCKNKFATQTDRIHVLTWPSDPDIVSYNLYRNGVLIAVIPNTQESFIYLDHNRCKNRADVYTLVGVNPFGVPIEPITVTLR